MTSRLKFFAAAALGLVLATGTLADVSAKTVTHQAHVATTNIAKAHHTKIATKGHRLHVAHLRHAHKLHVAHSKTSHRLAKVHGLKSTKDAGVTHREHHAETHRGTTKPASVIR
jgi:hypothetical protein